MPATIPGNTPAPAPARPAHSGIDPWAMERANDIIAAARSVPYVAALKDIALTLMLTRAEGVRDGLRQCSEINKPKGSS